MRPPARIKSREPSSFSWKPAIGEALPATAQAGAVNWRLPALWLVIHAAPLALLQFAVRRRDDEVEIDDWPWLSRGLLYGFMFLAIASSTSGDVEFIYFQF